MTKSQRAEGRCVPVRVAVSAWCVIGDQRSDIPLVRAHDRLVAEGVYSMARLRIVGGPPRDGEWHVIREGMPYLRLFDPINPRSPACRPTVG